MTAPLITKKTLEKIVKYLVLMYFNWNWAAEGNSWALLTLDGSSVK